MQKVLVANRGEIAVRVIQACRELGLGTVAIHSTADREALHVVLADEAICVGPAASTDSYLHQENVLAAAEVSGADAIHPGYGFLSENATFASRAEAAGFVWVGPSADVLARLADKSRARRFAQRAGVRVLAGSAQGVDDPEEAARIAHEVGFPVLLKASYGGGGRGLRIVRSPEEFGEAFATASAEAEAAFGRGEMYLERYLEQPRHIEVQILGDGHGNVQTFPERDCSIQRRHQKLLEETPAPGLSPPLRAELQRAAGALGRALRYRGAGTVEFLVAASGECFFIEINARIQVEHGITEEISGVDLVKAQLQIAGGRIPTLDPAGARGHAIECRLNAEDPETFLPSPGRVRTLRLPGGPGVRVDSHLYPGYVVPPWYDSLVAKIITVGSDREEARRRMVRALEATQIDGIRTNRDFQLRVVSSSMFRNAEISTSFVDRLLEGAG